MTVTEGHAGRHPGRGPQHLDGGRSRAVGAVRGVVLGLATLVGTAVLSVLLSGVSTRALLPLSRWRSPEPAADRLEHLFVGTVAAVGAAVAAWYTLSALVGLLCALARLCGATWRAGELVLRKHGAPGVSRLVGAGAGAVLAAGLSLTPAQADPPAPTPEPALAEDLTWAAAARETTEEDSRSPSPSDSSTGDPTTTDGTEDASAEAPGPTTPSVPAGDPAPATQAGGSGPSGSYLVQPGDTLWGIAAAHLGPGADDAQVAAAWPRWYEANAETIGTDPDLILPGTSLTAPD